MNPPKPLFKSRTALLGLLTSLAGIVGASNESAGRFLSDHAALILGVLGLVSIILRRITHGRVVLIPDSDDAAYRFRMFPVVLAVMGCVMSLGLVSCGTSGVNVSLDPIAGVCAQSADGRYQACYNPLTKAVTVKSAIPGDKSPITALAYDSRTKQWRGTLPDGSTAVYDANGLHVEPALPQG